MINVMGCFTLLSSQVRRPPAPEPNAKYPRLPRTPPPPPHLSFSRAQWYAHRLLHKMGKDCGHNHGSSANCGSDLLKP